MNELILKVESIIFCSPKPLSTQEIKNCIEEDEKKKISENKINEIIEVLINKYNNENFFEIIKLAKGYQFLTKSKYFNITKLLLKQHSEKRLSIASLETLSIIAYKQPIIKSEIEQIRGVNCDYTINKLLENLIEIKGKSDKLVDPDIYYVWFMDYFGINNLNELPTIQDFSEEENMIGDE